MFSNELHKLCEKHNIVELNVKYFIEKDSKIRYKKLSFRNNKLSDKYSKEMYDIYKDIYKELI